MPSNNDSGAVGCLGMSAGGSADPAPAANAKGTGKGKGKNKGGIPPFAKPKKKAGKRQCPDYTYKSPIAIPSLTPIVKAQTLAPKAQTLLYSPYGV